VKLGGNQTGGQQAERPRLEPAPQPVDGREPQRFAGPAGQSVPAPEVAPGGDGLFWYNFGLLLLLGIGACTWLLVYTDWFPIVGGLLGLGGVFAWFAFLAHVVNDDRKRQLQTWFDQSIMQARAFSVVLIGLLMAGGLAASVHGSVAIEHVQGGVDRVVQITDAYGKELVEPTRLGPGGAQKHLVWSGLFGRPEVWINVAGLPAIQERVRAWHVVELSVPGSFIRRPVLLVRPSARVSRDAAIEENDLGLAIAIKGAPVGTPGPYRGQLIWIGCERDVAVPNERWERWRLELRGAAVPEGWLAQPIAIEAERVLTAGDEIRVTILRKNGTEFVSANTVITPVDNFPQELVLE